MLVPRVVQFVVQVVMIPIHVTHTWVTTSEQVIPQYLRDRDTLITTIAELEDKLNQQIGLQAGHQYLLEENSRLRSLLHATSSRRIAAGVIARPDELPYDVLQLDQGSVSGVTVGSPVYVGEDMVIGVVSQVASNYSFVELLSAPGFTSTVFLGGPNVMAKLDGQGGGVMRVRVPQGVPLTVGNTVALPGINLAVIGRIVRVEQHPTQPEQYGYVVLPVALQSLHTVAIGETSDIRTDTTVIEDDIRAWVQQEALVLPDWQLSDFAVSTTSSSTATSTLPSPPTAEEGAESE